MNVDNKDLSEVHRLHHTVNLMIKLFYLEIKTFSQSFNKSCTFAPYAEINFKFLGSKRIVSFFLFETTYEPGGYFSVFSFSIFSVFSTFSVLFSSVVAFGGGTLELNQEFLM